MLSLQVLTINLQHLIYMAIGYTSGYIRKKVGDKVYYTNQNVKGTVKQVHRAYQNEVKQPLTRPRAEHKALFTAAANFRRSFASILDHSWQGQKYGINSLAHFMGIVTAHHGNKYPNFALQPRGAKKNIPQPWPISTGSLINTVEVSELSYLDLGAVLNLIYPDKTNFQTKGEFCQELIKFNHQLQDGDLLTFVELRYEFYGVQDYLNTEYIPAIDRYLIDANSSASGIEGIYVTENRMFRIAKRTGLVNNVIVRDYPGHDYFSACFGVIHSRLAPSGRYYLRNNAQMKVYREINEAFTAEEYKELCIRSWLDPEFLSSDWYLNQLK